LLELDPALNKPAPNNASRGILVMAYKALCNRNPAQKQQEV